MKRRRRRPVPPFAGALATAALILALGGCSGPDLRPGADPLVVGEGGGPASPDRVAAVGEMRRLGEASDALPYPDAFQAAQTRRLAARPEPRSAQYVAALQAELAALAVLRRSAGTPEEIAELEVREAALRKSIHEQAGKVER